MASDRPRTLRLCPTLTHTRTESHFSGQIESFLVRWTHWRIESHTRAVWDAHLGPRPQWCIGSHAQKRKKRHKYKHLFSSPQLVGPEHRGAHYWYLQYTWIHTNTHVYCTFIFSSLVANSTKISIKFIEKNSISISTIQCDRDKKYSCISAGSDLLNAVRVRIIKNYNVNIIHVTKREFLFQMSQQIIQSVSFSHR